MTKKRTKTTDTPLDFEAALQELEKLVEQMEKGELTLEESLQDFEHGIELTRKCQKALQQAEQRVQLLSGKNGDAELIPFEDDASSK
ncbi:MAG TPA: exodeoxyribonuclease VII small subunit [Gammaproteobacteria bacterium]|nr:exodeoxyribonuclease VII small subunit [Gammaproteobacteria bacterium]